MVNCLNNQFVSVFNELNTSPLPDLDQRCNFDCVMNDSHFAPHIILKRIKQMEPHKSVGVDGIHPLVIKKCSDKFASILSKIFTISFNTSIVPDTWKLANITSIFKKGCKLDPANYRPISLTAVPCKMMERIVRDTMLQHLMDNNLIANEQHGFVKYKSCLTNLLETLDILSNAMNNGHAVVLIFLDFAKAFDKVCHNSLFKKLSKYGFNGKILSWLKSFLSNRKQRVVLGQNMSGWRDVTSGIPQGSCIGPLLFVIFINDMPDVVKHILKLFADDSKLISIIKNHNDLSSIQKDLDSLVDWSRRWNMLFNAEKCKSMIVTKWSLPGPTPAYAKFHMATQDNASHQLQETFAEKDLGINFTCNLKFDLHSQYAAAKANRMLSLLKRTFRSWTIYNFKILYSAYIRPHLEYAAPVWSPYNKKDINILENVQRRATKLVPHVKNLQYGERLRLLGLTKLEDRRIKGDLIQIF